MKKRTLSLFLAVVLLLSVLPAVSAVTGMDAVCYYCVFEEDWDASCPVEGGLLHFSKEIGAVVSCDQSVTSAVIPAEIDGVAVTKIVGAAFKNCSQLTSVTIPESVTYIGDEAFCQCAALTDAKLPSGLRHLGLRAFDGTKCTETTATGTYKDGWLLKAAYDDNGHPMNEIHIDEGTIGISTNALYYSTTAHGTPVRYVLPSTIRYFSAQALTLGVGSVVFPETFTDLVKIGDCLYSKDGKSLVYYLPNYNHEPSYLIVPEGVETIEEGAFYGAKKLKVVSLPDSLETIGFQAFRFSNVEQVIFGKNLRTIGDYAFQSTPIRYINCGDSLESIGIFAFHGCRELTAAKFPATLKQIGQGAFYADEALVNCYFEGDAPAFGEFTFRTGDPITQTTIHFTISYSPEFQRYILPYLTFRYRQGTSGWTELEKYAPAVWEESEHVHAYQLEIIPETCLTDGSVSIVCACGDRQKLDVLHMTGHQYVYNGHGNYCMHCGKKDNMDDVRDSDWFAQSVYYALKNGLMNGVSDTKFAPNDPMTRAMLVTVLWRYEGSPEEGKNVFTDVPDGQWYAKAVAWAAENGIVGGVGDGKFDPNGNITREQMAAILFRYANKKGIDVTARGDLSKFPDAGKVSDWAKDPIAWAVGAGIIGGSDGKLLPQGSATRAQVATILMRFIENIAAK